MKNNFALFLNIFFLVGQLIYPLTKWCYSPNIQVKEQNPTEYHMSCTVFRIRSFCLDSDPLDPDLVFKFL